MKKGICILVLLVVAAALVSCSNSEFEGIVEIPVSDVEKNASLTKEEAEELCLDVCGDIAEENGFPISYRCIGTVSDGSKMYYVMHIAWLVNKSHWSYIGNCYVSSDGQEIYDGVVSDGKYEIMELRWRKNG